MKCFVHARVATQNPRQPWAEAVVTDRGLITFVGRAGEARVHAGKNAEVIDLGGRLLLPGFIDNHTHFLWGGQHLLGIDLRPCTSKEEFIDTLRTYVADHRGTWVENGTWDHEQWRPSELPHRAWIDPFTADTPVFVQRLDGHMGLANALALERAGITAETPDPPGGRIERDPGNGEPTGLLRDSAMLLVAQVIPEPAAAAFDRYARAALAEARKNGITSIQDITRWEHLPVYRALEEEGALTVRVYGRLPLEDYGKLVEAGIRHGSGSAFLRLGSMKAFADGSLGSSTALFYDPYADDPSNRGLAMDAVTSGKLRAWAAEADRHALQLSLHAIGDRANGIVLDIIEDIVRTNPPWDRRPRIEHAQHLRPADIPRFASLGVIVSAQPYHCIDDGAWAESRLGRERLRSAFAFRSLLDAGARVCFGSDWTVAPLSALLGMYAAVTRRTLDGRHPGGWIPEQRLTVEEAVACYTRHNAYAAFEESEKGTIEKGKVADLVVVSDDLYTIPPERIKDARVTMTVFNGEIVHRDP
jgi:predicted amidohydrolase YtcJ